MKIAINNNITKLLTTYSDVAIYNEFYQASKNLMQFSPEYHNDSKKLNILLVNLTQRQIEFRNALVNPLLNKIEIENHFKYLFDKSINDNGQLRGFQVHFSSKMFREFGQAGNDIINSNLSANHLSSLILPVLPFNVTLPSSLFQSSPFSFQEGLEVLGAKMYSSVTPGTDIIHVTADNPSFIKKNINYSNYIDNKPSCNSNGDYIREHKNLAKNSVTISEDDAKSQGIGLVFCSRILKDPRVMCVGTVDPLIERQYNIAIATKAINGSINYNIKHLDPQKNNSKDIINVLKKAQQTGKTEDLIELSGIPIILSNDTNQ